MAVKAAYEVTITDNTDIDSLVTWYYLTTSATKPAAPTTTQTSAAVPSPWTQNEPTFTAGTVTNYLYCCIQTRWKDGSCTWGTVQLSSSYEQAKQAWNKANAAQDTANAAAASAEAAAITRSDSGKRSIVTEDAAELPLITIDAYGESVQDGTPTPDAPVYIRALRSPHRFPGSNSIGVGIGRATTEQWGVYSGTPSTIANRDDETVEKTFVNQWNGLGIAFYGESPFQVGDEFNVSCSFRNDSSVNAAISLYAMETNSSGSRVYTGLIVDGTGTSIGFPSVAVGRTVRYSQYCIWTQSCQDLLDAGGSIFLTFQFTNSSSTGGSLTMYNPMLSMGKFPREWAKEGTVLVKSSGKNMLDETNAFYATNMAYYGRISDKMTPIRLSSGTYTISTSDGSVASGLYAMRYDSDATAQTHKQEYNVRSLTFTLDTETLVYVGGYWANSDRGDRKIQLEYGDTATSYELYSESSVSIDLKGHELHGLDSTYRDTLSVDANGSAVIHKKCGKTTVGEMTSMTRYADYVYWGKIANMLGQDVTSGTAHNNTHPLLSTNFIHSTGSGCVWSGGSAGQFTRHTVANYPTCNHGLFFKTSTNYDGGPAFQAAFADTEIIYPLDEPYDISIGRVDLPQVTDSSTVHVDAEVQPVIDASWWTKAGYNTGLAINQGVNMTNSLMASQKPYIVGTQTAATYDWKGDCPELSELKEGQQITYVLPYSVGGTAISAAYTTISSGASTNTTGAALTLTLADGSSTGQVPIWYGSGMGRVTNHYGYGSVITMTYREDVTMSGTYHIDKGWFVDAEYNTDTINRTRWQNVILAAAAITNGYVICGTASGYRNVAAGVTFDLSYPLLYCATTKAAGETSDNNFLQINGIKITNNGTVTSAANYKTVYLIGTVSGNTFTVKASPFMTTVGPTSEDGFFYIPLGVFYNSTTNIYFNSTKDLYAYIDGKFRQVTPTEVVAEQQVYIQAAQNAVSTEPPTAWVEYSAESTTATETDGTTTWSTPVWTTKRPTFSSEYPVVLVAMQRKRIDGTVTCTRPLIDDTTTVIDGGRLITGSVTANAIDATDLHVQAANIDGTLTASQIDTEGLELSVSAITGLGDQLSNISGELSGKASSEDVSALSDTVSGMSATVETALGDGGTVEKLRSDVDTIQAHISLGTIGEGSDMQPAITLDAEGGSSDGFKNVITNTSMSFMYGNETVAEVNKDELDITRTKVTESMQLGNFMWIPLSDGSLAFKWVEEDE